MEANDQNTIAPGGVVPFQISDRQASDDFQKWIRKKWFCPKLAKDCAKPDKFKGIYLPYWTFDTNTFTSYTGEYGIDHTEKDRDGNTRTVTNWHRTFGNYNEFIDDELVLASKNHDRSILHALEPFDTENNKGYKPEYIAGFVAERYSVGLKDAWNLAKPSIKNKLKNHISKDIEIRYNADRVRNLMINTQFNDVTYKYLLLPIWISNFKYGDKVYQFMVNGQTGKVSGKTPVSIPKVILTILGVIALLVLFHYLGLY